MRTYEEIKQEFVLRMVNDQAKHMVELLCEGESGSELTEITEYITKGERNTCVVEVHGPSLKDADIVEGDILMVSRRTKATDNLTVVVIDGEVLVRYYVKDAEMGLEMLFSANDEYKPVVISDEMKVEWIGVVTGVCMDLKSHRLAIQGEA